LADRVGQGLFGATIMPLGQGIVLATFPRHLHTAVMVIWGAGSVMGPVFGPIFGSMMAEAYNWRAAFFMIVPPGIVALVCIWFSLSEYQERKPTQLDWTGFLALSVAITTLQLMIDRGQKLRCFTIPVWEDCGKPEELLQTNRYLLARDDPEPRAYPDSVVIRPSYVDPGATVARSVIGPHASIGAGATVEGATIENSIVGERATVRNLALSGSILSADAAVHGPARRLNLGATSELAE